MDSNAAGWFSYVIVFAELAVGIGPILGAFTGLAATGGLLMNMAFMLAEATSTNPVLAIMGVLLILEVPSIGSTASARPSRGCRTCRILAIRARRGPGVLATWGTPQTTCNGGA